MECKEPVQQKIALFKRKRVSSFSPTVPKPEIDHDLYVIENFAERVKYSLDKNSERKQETLSCISAFLALAKTEENTLRAWTYTNLADAHLPLVVEPDELKAAMQRLKSQDASLPDYLKKRLEPSPDGNYDYSEKNRNDLYRIQLNRVYLWNAANVRRELKLKVWNRVLFFQIIGLSMLIYVCERFITSFGDATYKIDFPFLVLASLGFVGGALSAYLKAPEDVRVTSHQLQKKQMVLRMFFGCAGSIVVFISILAFSNDLINDFIEKNVFAFFALGIFAGFSERFFVDTLNKMGEKFVSSSSDKDGGAAGEVSVASTEQRDRAILEEIRKALAESAAKSKQ